MNANHSSTEQSSTGILSKVKGLLGSSEQFQPAQLNGDAYDEAVDALKHLENSDYTLLAVRPPLESDGIMAAARLFQGNAFHDVRLGVLKRQQSPRFAHEIRYEDGKIVFYVGAQDQTKANAIKSKVRADYKNVDISRATTSFPAFQEGEYAAAARVHLARPFYYPIKSPLTEQGDPDPVTDVDPYRDLLTDMVLEQTQLSDGTAVSTNDCRVMVQAVCQPARDVWSKQSRFGMDVKEVARQQKKGELKTHLMGDEKVRRADTTSRDTKAAKIIDNQRGQKGYYVRMRVLAFSPYPEIAQRRVRQVAGDYSKYFESFTEQSLTAESVPASEVPQVVVNAIYRQQKLGLTDRLTQFNQTKFLLTRWGLASICHLPNEDVNVPEVDFATMETGPGVPADAPQMEDVSQSTDTEDTRTRTLNAGGASPDRRSTESAGAPDPSPATAAESGTDDEHGRDPTAEDPSSDSSSLDGLFDDPTTDEDPDGLFGDPTTDEEPATDADASASPGSTDPEADDQTGAGTGGPSRAPGPDEASAARGTTADTPAESERPVDSSDGGKTTSETPERRQQEPPVETTDSTDDARPAESAGGSDAVTSSTGADVDGEDTPPSKSTTDSAGRRGGPGDLGSTYDDGVNSLDDQQRGGLVATLKRLFGGR